MRSAIVILSVFAAVWGGGALAAAHMPAWTLAGPVLISAALAALAFQGAPFAPRDAAEGRRIGRLVALASVLEGVAILVGVNLVAGAGRPDLATTVVAAAVGLHFLPLARWIPARVYYATASGLLACAAAGPLVAAPLRDVVVCGGSALTLWTTVASFRVSPRRTLAAA